MSLPPGFLDELRTRTSISQVVGRKVMWDTRKSNQGKGDMWAPCPFHQEKTASFHVDDRKGYYYCFGCHAKGDALGFIKETENVSFMEAVEILAGEAGMQMPARDPKAKEKADRRTQLVEVMDHAVKFFRLQLQTGAASDAREYLAGRGLDEAAQDKFEIGFAPDAWQGLWDHLVGKGVAEDLILAAGLAKPSNTGKRPYDTFRNRIMFPIRDVRGRAMAFGGRAMDPNDNAKYLNSPETELFDKGRSLYHHAPAREAAGKGHSLIVAEGYMDVIALNLAGFQASVAPLGTAVTEHQLQLLWRVSDEPIIALDGDKAGLRAALRVIDLALPLLEAGKSLRFAMMPDGKDPDDVLRAGGRGAMKEILSAAKPMVHLLWQRETEGKTFDSPERKAALDKSLREHLRRIKDPSIRSHYGQEIKDLRWNLFRPPPRKKGGWQAPDAPQAVTKTSFLAQSDVAPSAVREAVILASILTNPWILPEVLPDLEGMEFEVPQHAQLLGFLLSYIGEDTALLEATQAGFGHDVLTNLTQRSVVRIAPAVRRAGEREFVRDCLKHELTQLVVAQSGQRALSEALDDFDDTADEGLTWRLGQLSKSREDADRGGPEKTVDFAIGKNGAKMDVSEREALENLAKQIDFSKTKQR